MKKDQKFLLKLEECLSSISKKKKDTIVLKYRELIDKEKNMNKRILDILKNLGSPEEVAEKEIKYLKDNAFIKRLFRKKEAKEVIVTTTEDSGFIAEEEPVEKIVDEVKDTVKTNKKQKDKKKKKNKSKSKKTKYIRRAKWNFKNLFGKIKSIFKKKTKTEKIVNKTKNKVNKIVEDVQESIDDTIEEVAEVVSETKIFETKKQRIKRIVFKTLGIIFITILVFIFLWATVIFIASCFSILDGLRVYGIVASLFGIMLLLLWFVLLIYRLIFKKKVNTKLLIISVIVIVFIIACGIGYTVYQYYKVEEVDDVSVKYTMTTSLEKYKLPSNNRKLNISFNSNYKTKYVIEYDDKLDNQIKVEVRYYECYYDYYVKSTATSLYVSLGIDPRDRLSTYINDLKDYQVYNAKELSRYSVKITMNEKDKDRVIFQ